MHESEETNHRQEAIDELEFDEYNEAEMARHGVTVREVMQVHTVGFRLLRNAKAHRARYLMVGKTYGGRWLTIPIAPTDKPGTWRPATAFPSRLEDRSKLKGDIA
jgi:uncharacterized DUF497 family protein